MLSEEIMKEFLENRIVFHCSTRKSYVELMNSLKPTYDYLSNRTWEVYKEETCVDYIYEQGMAYCNVKYYKEYCPELKIVRLPLENFSEAQQDLETLRSLFLKYNVCIAGNLEKAIEAKVQEVKA